MEKKEAPSSGLLKAGGGSDPRSATYFSHPPPWLRTERSRTIGRYLRYKLLQAHHLRWRPASGDLPSIGSGKHRGRGVHGDTGVAEGLVDRWPELHACLLDAHERVQGIATLP